MDIIELVATRKIEEAIARGEFDGLPQCGWIDCSIHGEAFIVQWWREKVRRDEAQHREPLF